MATEHAEGQFEPKPPVRSSRIPAWQILFRGLALLLLALVVSALVMFAGRLSPWVAIAVLPAAVPVVLLAVWGALVQLSGGEKFDDHPWI